VIIASVPSLLGSTSREEFAGSINQTNIDVQSVVIFIVLPMIVAGIGLIVSNSLALAFMGLAGNRDSRPPTPPCALFPHQRWLTSPATSCSIFLASRGICLPAVQVVTIDCC
jgi:hypothetical protein